MIQKKKINKSKSSQNTRDVDNLNKWFMVIIPVGVAIIAIMPVIPGYIIHKNKKEPKLTNRRYEPWRLGYDVQMSRV